MPSEAGQLRHASPGPTLAGAGEARLDLIGRTREELADILRRSASRSAVRPMRVRQIWHWLYHRGVTRLRAA